MCPHLIPQSPFVWTTPKSRFSLAILENSQNQLLLLQRSDQETFAPSQWGFPGGHIESGESPAQAIARELDEELAGPFKIELRHTVGPIRDRAYGGIFEVYLFHFHDFGSHLALNHEHQAYIWESRDQIPYRNLVLGTLEDLEWLFSKNPR